MIVVVEDNTHVQNMSGRGNFDQYLSISVFALAFALAVGLNCNVGGTVAGITSPMVSQACASGITNCYTVSTSNSNGFS